MRFPDSFAGQFPAESPYVLFFHRFLAILILYFAINIPRLDTKNSHLQSTLFPIKITNRFSQLILYNYTLRSFEYYKLDL